MDRTGVLDVLLGRLREWGRMGCFEVVLTPDRTWLWGPATGLRHEPAETAFGAEALEVLRAAARAEAETLDLRTPHVADGEHRWRATEAGRALVLRRMEHAPALDEYGETGRALRAYVGEEADDDRAGLYVVAGRPGSGKSALLSALLREALARGRACYYVDEAMEFDLTRLPEAAPVFIRAGRAAELWADGEAAPEVLRLAGVRDVFVGEVRSSGDVRSAAGLAALGYRVWTTLHAAGPEVAVRRLRPHAVEPGLLRAVVYVELFPSPDRRAVVPVAGLYVLEEIPEAAEVFDEALRQAAARSRAWREALLEAVEAGRLEPNDVPPDRRRWIGVRPAGAAAWTQ